jgi:hypothetical protein
MSLQVGRFARVTGWRAFRLSLAIFLGIAAVTVLVLRAILGPGHATIITVLGLVVAGSVTGMLFAPTKQGG